MASLKLLLDTALNRSYTGYEETKVISASTTRGKQNRLGIADAGEATILVESADGRWYQDRANAISGLARGIGARLSAVTTSGTATILTGRIESIRPVLADGGIKFAAEVTLRDVLHDLAEVDVTTELKTSQRIDGLISGVATEAGWQHGTSITSGNNPDIVGWNWFTQIPALQAIDELAQADGGTVFTTRAGRLDFHDRDFRIASRASVNLDLSSYRIVGYDEDQTEVYTAVKVKVHRRRLSSQRNIFEHFGNLKLNVGQTRRLLYRVQNPISSMAAPVWQSDGVKDWDFYKQKGDGSPDDTAKRNGSVTVNVHKVDAEHIRYKITNNHSTDKLVSKSFKVRGRAILERSPLVVRRQSNLVSIIGSHSMNDANVSGGVFKYEPLEGVYYRRRFEVDNPWVQTSAQANRLAAYMLKRISTPQPDIRIDVRGTTEAEKFALASLEISDRIQLTVAAVGLTNRNYWLDGIEHRYDENGAWTSTLRLTPCFFVTQNRRDRISETVQAIPTGLAVS